MIRYDYILIYYDKIMELIKISTVVGITSIIVFAIAMISSANAEELDCSPILETLEEKRWELVSKQQMSHVAAGIQYSMNMIETDCSTTLKQLQKEHEHLKTLPTYIDEGRADYFDPEVVKDIATGIRISITAMNDFGSS